MNFKDGLQGGEVLSRNGESALFAAAVTGVQHDSRRVEPGSVFVAMKGEATDGNRYIDGAIKAGAVGVVSDSPSEPARPGVALASVPHGRRPLATSSANFYGHPAKKLKITGVTATNSNTTTSFIHLQ